MQPKPVRKFIKETRFIQKQEIITSAGRERKMFFYYLNLRKHNVFDFIHDFNSYACGTYINRQDTIYFDYFDQSTEFLKYDFGVINTKDSIVKLYRKNSEEILELNLLPSN